MAAYYNEHDPFAAAWLRELIKAGLIADGEVDERSIELVRPEELRGFVQCHFFAGIGGWSLALRLAGWHDARPVWTGSCPCQPFSSAGAQAGGHDPRDLWPVWFQLVKECRPVVVFGEQVEAAIGHGWLDRLCDDLEAEDYAVGACGLPGPCVGAFDIRQRLWFVADCERERFSRGDRSQGARLRDAVERHGAIGGMADALRADGERRAGSLSGPEAARGGARRVDGRGAHGPEHGREVGELADADERHAEYGAIQRGGKHGLRTQGGRADGHAGVAEQPGGGMADAEHAERRSVGGSIEDERNRRDAGRPEAHGQLGARRQVRDMAIADRGRLKIADVSVRPEGQDEAAALQRRTHFWSAVDWIPCADGKARPVEPGTFPLAHGVPARVGRLRGYGNAIKPQVAQVFIESYMSVTV